jgi:hypothetical protein
VKQEKMQTLLIKKRILVATATVFQRKWAKLVTTNPGDHLHLVTYQTPQSGPLPFLSVFETRSFCKDPPTVLPIWNVFQWTKMVDSFPWCFSINVYKMERLWPGNGSCTHLQLTEYSAIAASCLKETDVVPFWVQQVWTIGNILRKRSFWNTKVLAICKNQLDYCKGLVLTLLFRSKSVRRPCTGVVY